MNWEGAKRGIGLYLWFEAGYQMVVAIQNKTPGNVGIAAICVLVSLIWFYPLFQNNGGS